MNIFKIAISFILGSLCVNRVLYFVDTYQRLSQESDTDSYMVAMCEKMDYRQVGRHAVMCDDLRRKLATPVFIHAIHDTINDTIYREISMHGLVTCFLGVSLVTMLSNLHHRYVKLDTLPTTASKMKMS